MKTFNQFKEETEEQGLERIATGGQQQRGPTTNTSSDNLKAQALQKRKEGASAQAQKISQRQLQQKQINQQKREGGVNR